MKTRAEILSKLNESLNAVENAIQDLNDSSIEINDKRKGIKKLYDASCMNYTGKTSNTEDYYSEVIAEELLNKNITSILNRIPVIERKSYKVESHDGNQETETNRQEEIKAKLLFNKTIDNLGKIVDYQIPLKDVQGREAGKIDLISFNEKPYIIEFKYESPETLLRAVLEIAVYYQQLDKEKFISSFEEFKNCTSGDIRKAVLLTPGCNAVIEFNDLSNRPNLKELIKRLNIDVFVTDNFSVKQIA